MKTLVVMAALLLIGSNALAADRLVKCQIGPDAKPDYKGTCLYQPEKGGSFALSNPAKDKPLYGEILIVSVYVVEPGVAEVRGLTSAGNNSRWGEAKRDKACWVGADFKVCAW